MFWKWLLLASVVAVTVAGQSEKNIRAHELIDLLSRTFSSQRGSFAKKGSALIHALKSEFPDLPDFTNQRQSYPDQEPVPGYGDEEPPPGYGDEEHPPGYGEEEPPPVYGEEHPPGYGEEHPPGYGEEEHPPGYGDEESDPNNPYYVPPVHNIKDEIFTIIRTIFTIMRYQGLLTSSGEPVENLINSGFALLADYIKRKSLESRYGGTDCPYSYDKAGDTCLAFDANAQELTWSEARLYCQIIKGGDLAIFRNANEFADIIKFVRKFDPERKHAFWMGLSINHYNYQWTFINGEPVPLGTPFWGSKIVGGPQNPSEISGYDYGFLDNIDHYYLGDISNEDAVKTHFRTVPLCQYFHGRGHDASHNYHAQNFYHEDASALAMKFADLVAASAASYDFDRPVTHAPVSHSG